MRGAAFPAGCEKRQAASATQVRHYQRLGVDHFAQRDGANGSGPGHPLQVQELSARVGENHQQPAEERRPGHQEQAQEAAGGQK